MNDILRNLMCDDVINHVEPKTKMVFLTAERHLMGIFYILHLYCGGGYTGVYIYQNSSNSILRAPACYCI